jgi:phage-related protein
MKYTIFVSLFAGAAAFAPIAHKTSSTAVPPFVTTSTALVSSVADPKMSSTALNMGIMDFWNAFNPYIMIVGFAAVVTILASVLTQAKNEIKADVEKKLEDFKDVVDNRFDVIDKRFDLVDKSLEDFKDVVDKRFDLVEKRFDLVDKRFDLVDKRFDVIDKRLDVVDSRFDANDKNIEELKDDFGKQFRANNKKIKAGVAGIKQILLVKFDAQEKVLEANIKGQLLAHDVKIEAHDKEIEALKKKLK